MNTRTAGRRQFPPGFVWGAATSAYQIEGSPLADGAGASIWHRFAHTPGRVANGDTGDVACDHYRRFREDVALLRDLGLRAYRFSIAWGRVMPDGRGRVNAAGLGFYERLVDALLEAGIEPYATLYHWDLPAALDDRGGWTNPDISGWFADYADVMYRALDGRVKKWATMNEPWVVTDGGYLHGTMAPGHRGTYGTALASRNLMRAHGSAVDAYRACGRHEIGLVVNVEPKYPASRSAADLAATARAEAYMNRQYLDPAYLGRCPDELRDVFGEAWVEWSADDLALASRKIDYVGLNWYTRAVVRDDATNWPERAARVPQAGAEHTETGWEVYPAGLTDTLLWMTERYGRPPIYITENGAAMPDPATASGERVHDPRRVAYLRSHIGAVHDAIARGADVRGYFVWSMLDNFEWAHGFSKRFGIVHVDYATGRRTKKASADFYARVAATHGAALDD